MKDVFEIVGELTYMRDNFVDPVLIELRNGQRSNPRQRIEKLDALHPNTERVSSVGGNSKIYVKDGGRVKERQSYQVVAHYLLGKDISVPDIAIFPFGIDGVTDAGSAIFQDPNASKMRSICLVYPPMNNGDHWLQHPVEPLFNIDEDGVVLARFNDLPTPTELQLLLNILDQFEVESLPKK